jgi:hypothetical protein
VKAARAEVSVITPSYPNILSKIQKGNVVPFFGAGASMGPPPAPDSPAGAGPAPAVAAPAYAPSASALASKLAKAFGLNGTEFEDEIKDLAKVTSFGDAIKAREALRDVLHTELGKDLTLGPIHQVTADLAKHLRLIVTTNYDLLLEKAMGDQPYHLVVQGVASDDPPGEAILWWPPGVPTKADPQKRVVRSFKDLDPEKAEAPIIYKLHGSVLPEKNDCFVISEADYIGFLRRISGGNGIPAYFAKYMRSRSLLFLGYSLADWNVRLLLQPMFFNKRSTPGLAHWAINWHVKPLEKSIWDKRGIQVFDMPLDDFADGLRVEMNSRVGR